MYRELIEQHIGNRGHIVPAGEIFPVEANYTRYCSLFMFGQDIIPYVKTNKSVKDFKGKVYTEAIWIDVDNSKDTNQARLSAIEVVKRLNQDYGVNPEHLFIYFSGKKGFHIALHNTLVGFNHSTPVEPEKVKDFVRRLTIGIANVDLIIYEPVRIFRIENSKHESGLYKIRISYDELICEMSDILNLAKSPRSYPYKTNFSEIGLKQGLQNLWINSGSYIAEQKDFEYNGNLFAPPQEGSRNKTLLVQACTLFRKSELSSNAVLDIISNAAYISSIGSKEPIEQSELKRIVQNAERLVGGERKKPLEDEIQLKSFGEWIPDWENYVLQEQTEMSLCFYDLNNLMKGRLKGKLGVVMGYGGSKKSLFALNVCLRNMKQGEISIYSTMEMSAPQMINRIIDHEVYVEGQPLNAHEVLTAQYRKDVNEGRKFLKDQLAKEIGNKILITANSRMTYAHYKTCIDKCREMVGQPSILVVDGLSMMGGKGKETENYSDNSRDLKELAKEENIFILLIAHVTKGAELHTRDLSRHVRGSEKILDNCDFYMTMSQIQIPSEPERYMRDMGFINFYDKRGSGETVNMVYNFEPRRLKLTDCSLDWRDYYKEVKQKNKHAFENDF